MNAQRLLELSSEYETAKTHEGMLASIGVPPARTLEQIAEEYGQALKEFLNA